MGCLKLPGGFFYDFASNIQLFVSCEVHAGTLCETFSFGTVLYRLWR